MLGAVLQRDPPCGASDHLSVAGASEVVTPVQDTVSSVDRELVRRLRSGDAEAFTEIVRAWSPAMLHVARSFVASHASAEEAVQETWLAVVRGLDDFQERSSLRTWTMGVLANIARRQGVREHRTVSAASFHDQDAGPTVSPDRFRSSGRWVGGWRAGAAPEAWGPEAAALSDEVRSLLAQALAELPSRQRAVVQLRDVDGMNAEEVSAMLGISLGNQRVLLHRARAKLRGILENYYCSHRRERSS